MLSTAASALRRQPENHCEHQKREYQEIYCRHRPRPLTIFPAALVAVLAGKRGGRGTSAALPQFRQTSLLQLISPSWLPRRYRRGNLLMTSLREARQGPCGKVAVLARRLYRKHTRRELVQAGNNANMRLLDIDEQFGRDSLYSNRRRSFRRQGATPSIRHAVNLATFSSRNE